MAVSDKKTGVLVNMDKELKTKLSEIAKQDGRTLTNLINKILSDYIDENDLFKETENAKTEKEYDHNED